MKIKRLLSAGIALLLSATTLCSFTSCGKKQKTDEDPTKANLYVATYNGGVGREWLDDAAKRFEKMYENATNFEEGKKGVKIHVDADKDVYTGTRLSDTSLTKDVYFTEGVEYFTFVNRGKVADISDAVTGSMSAYGESGTIESKLDPSIKSYLTAKDGKYYMLPFYDGFYGFIYDVELFEQKGFYYDKEGDFLRLVNESQREEFEANKSNGPDGVKGTYDDGLPATYDQFSALIDYISKKNCVPFCYSGGDIDYVDKSFRSFAIDYEGYDSFLVNYTFDGTIEVVDNIDNSGNVTTKTVDITLENGYEVQRQAGKYYALKMQEELFKVNYVGGVWNGTAYSQAQKDFIKSKYTNTPYAILTEGVWWENEATKGFADMESFFGEKKTDRRFAFMPMPKANEDKIGEKQTLLSSNSSYCFVSKDCKNMDLAKEFIRFLHTDAEMSKFTSKTSIPRALNYKVSEEDKKAATHYGRSVISLKESADVIYPYSSLDIVINKQSAFTEKMWLLTTSVNGKKYDSPAIVFKDGITDAKTYFLGLYTFQQEAWKDILK